VPVVGDDGVNLIKISVYLPLMCAQHCVLSGSLCAETTWNNEEHLEQPCCTARGHRAAQRLVEQGRYQDGTKMIPRCAGATIQYWC
jgi:hypothetical protein